MQSLIILTCFLLCASGEQPLRTGANNFAFPTPRTKTNAAEVSVNRNRAVEDLFKDVIKLPAGSQTSPLTLLNLGNVLQIHHHDSPNGTQTSHLGSNETETTNPTNFSSGNQDAEVNFVLKRSLRSLADFLGLERDGEISDEEELPVKDSDQEISVNEDPDRKPDLLPRISEEIDDREGEISDEEDPPVKEPEHDISVDESLADGSHEGRSL